LKDGKKNPGHNENGHQTANKGQKKTKKKRPPPERGQEEKTRVGEIRFSSIDQKQKKKVQRKKKAGDKKKQTSSQGGAKKKKGRRGVYNDRIKNAKKRLGFGKITGEKKIRMTMRN